MAKAAHWLTPQLKKVYWMASRAASGVPPSIAAYGGFR